MYVTTCFAYEDVTMKVRQVEGTIAIEFSSEQNHIDLSLLLHPIQCKIIGEAMQIAAMNMSIADLPDECIGSVSVKFDSNKTEGLPCQPINLSA
ncbi:hypothetical protein SDC9_20882 [bioreactor metagenome]|uniref:Uncharacterized protein n=1 Tax=bioreactor metagenome TaxID=1076179 RepID=A0A644U7Y8_9ZZZZ|nr:hypothetical protein [Negativicutes bacterium]